MGQLLQFAIFSPPPQPTVNAAGADIEFTCPGNGYLGGFQSEFDSASFDRRWAPYCCQRPFAALIDCIQPTSGWENDFRTTLNFSAPEGHIIAGVTSYFFNRLAFPIHISRTPSTVLYVIMCMIMWSTGTEGGGSEHVLLKVQNRCYYC